jgi:hypothetical protein
MKTTFRGSGAAAQTSKAFDTDWTDLTDLTDKTTRQRWKTPKKVSMKRQQSGGSSDDHPDLG